MTSAGGSRVCKFRKFKSVELSVFILKLILSTTDFEDQPAVSLKLLYSGL